MVVVVMVMMLNGSGAGGDDDDCSWLVLLLWLDDAMGWFCWLWRSSSVKRRTPIWGWRNFEKSLSEKCFTTGSNQPNGNFFLGHIGYSTK